MRQDEERRQEEKEIIVNLKVFFREESPFDHADKSTFLSPYRILCNNTMSLKSKNLSALVFLILISVILRIPGFFLSHSSNDELIHTGLALKIDKYGAGVFRGRYNLYNIDINPKNKLLNLSLTGKEIGKLVSSFGYWESHTLSHHPPLFSAFLALSHRVFARNKPYFLADSLLGTRDIPYQFYAGIVPFLFSILLIIATYLLGKILFNQELGLLSALLFSVTPVELLTSQKIWADDMASFFAILAVIFYFYGLKNNKNVFSCLSGISCGLSVLTKMNGYFIAVAIIIFHLWQNKRRLFNKDIIDVVFQRGILLFVLFFILTTGAWGYVYLSTFGMQGFFIPFLPKVYRFSHGFMGLVYTRPWYTYFITMPLQFPIYFLIYPAIFYLFRERKKELQFLFILLLVFLALLSIKENKEERYMLPCYPAIAIISSYALSKLNSSFGAGKRAFFKGALMLLCILSVWFSIRLGLYSVFTRADLFTFPL